MITVATWSRITICVECTAARNAERSRIKRTEPKPKGRPKKIREEGKEDEPVKREPSHYARRVSDLDRMIRDENKSVRPEIEIETCDCGCHRPISGRRFVERGACKFLEGHH